MYTRVDKSTYSTAPPVLDSLQFRYFGHGLSLASSLPMERFVSLTESAHRIELRWVMMHKMMVSAIVGGLLVGYATLLYALVHIIVVMNHSYLLSLAS